MASVRLQRHKARPRALPTPRLNGRRAAGRLRALRLFAASIPAPSTPIDKRPAGVNDNVAVNELHIGVFKVVVGAGIVGAFKELCGRYKRSSNVSFCRCQDKDNADFLYHCRASEVSF